MSRRRQDRAGERGAVIVEVTIIVPILILLVIGVAEIGLIVRDHQTAVAATRSAARAVSSAGDARLADHDALATMAAALVRVDPTDIEHIVIFEPEPDGSMPIGCEAVSVPDKCNRYVASDLTLAASAFSGTTTCDISAPDVSWCPLDRETAQSVGLDWIGVRLQFRHHSVAPFLSDRSVSDTTIMRVEPRFES